MNVQSMVSISDHSDDLILTVRTCKANVSVGPNFIVIAIIQLFRDVKIWKSIRNG